MMAKQLSKRRFSRVTTILLILCMASLLSACNLISQRELQQQVDATATQLANQKPVISILSPLNNAEFTLGSPIPVSVSATDTIGITRITLSVNGNVVDSAQSEAPDGNRSLNALLEYTPNAAGSVQLTATAYRANVASEPAVVTINVRQTQAQVTATQAQQPNIPTINPNDPTCRALVNIGLNVRSGPGTNFPVISVLAAGSVVPLSGRTSANDWLQIRVTAIQTGWVNAPFTTLYGNCALIPIIAPPSTPVPVPPTATFTLIPPTNTLTLTAQPPTATATPGPADLVVTSIIGPNPITLGAGNTPVSATFSVTITNTGQSQAAPQFTTTLEVQGSGVVIPIGVVANLLPGESIILSGDLAFSAAGTFTVIARTDSLSQINEISEANNMATLQVNVNANP